MEQLGSESRYNLLVGGARSGKTWLLVRAICVRAIKYPGSRHLIARHRFNAVKASVGQDTLPKVLRDCFPSVDVKMNKADLIWTFPNGSEIWLGGLDEKERTEKILGQEFSTIYLNEASQITWATVELVKTRLAQVVPGLKQKLYVDLNPPMSSHWCHRLFIEKRFPTPPYDPIDDPENYQWLRINPIDNEANLSEEFLDGLQRLSERERKRFWAGEWGSETENALWTVEELAKWRVRKAPELFTRVVIGVDPSGTKGEDEEKRSDHVGIVVVGLGSDGIIYVLEDLTLRAGPAKWGKAVVSAFQRHEADLIVAETNFGGAMVEHVIRSAASEMRQHIAYREVKASRGKVVRAEPIAALYEKGSIRHVGEFPQLEDQMCNFTTVGYMGDLSPDRADALIWALTELFPGATKKVPRANAGQVRVEGMDTFDPLRWR